MFRKSYGEVFDGDERWNALEVPTGDRFAWDERVDLRPAAAVLRGHDDRARAGDRHRGRARARACSATASRPTTSRPPGSIKRDSPAGKYLIEHGVEPEDFNSYGARRGNHEVMMRGTFANIRLRNQLAPGHRGRRHAAPAATASRCRSTTRRCGTSEEGTPLVVLAGKEYGSGSSRDWAAKGTRLLGVRAVIAESFERIHRSNLVGMGVLPLQFTDGDTAQSLGLTGHETFSDRRPRRRRRDPARGDGQGRPGRSALSSPSTVRIDTPKEQRYYRHGGILQYVLRTCCD